MSLEFETVRSPEEFLPSTEAWDRLAGASGTPYLSEEWLLSWWRALGDGPSGGGQTFVLLGRDSSGVVRAGAAVQRRPGRRLLGASDVHSSDWDVVSDSEAARRECWQAIVRRGASRLHLPGLSETALATARDVLEAERYAVFASADEANPRQPLPGSWEELMSSLTAKLRSRLRQLERSLQAAGTVTFRTTRDGSALEPDLEALLALEASGWKGRERTAILADPRTTMLYRDFALRAAAKGRLRLHLLELDGTLIAGDLGWVHSGGAFVIKTAYSEDHGPLSPGLVLRKEVLRASIEEGCRFYDFLGSPQPWKLRWGATPQTRWTVDAYRGAWRPAAGYRRRLRPLLKTTRDRLLRPRDQAGSPRD